MKTAIVMSGGGAKGGFECGAVKALLEKGIRPDVYYGTSVGALNALALAYWGVDYCEKQWLATEGADDVIWDKFPLALPWSTGFKSMHPLRKTLEEMIRTAKAQTEAVLCVVDFKRCGRVLYPNTNDCSPAEMAKWAEASSAIPIVMELVDDRYADGGVREQTPLKKAIDDGAEKIIVVLCNPVTENLFTTNWKPSFPHILSVALRTADILTHEIFLNDLKVCRQKNRIEGYRKIDLTVIAPPSPLADTLDFSPARIRSDLELGYRMGLEAAV